ncbi:MULTISPECIES: ribosome assembly cofactor RimP [unclassified Prochlorococcus]|uniref:ribosome assembly cofactor RimP n=1 Tax=unclassified Prochlorococcus TaxID=2627481 RepID=UPI0005339F78|nr:MULTISPECIES: ribosome assembly cofactor RimP [unclassified Prochlorococcus]KGG14746.1 hypothetical protein EV06_1807 [Prochlorococcus sp. MIT 0602]KGG15823.1 hypothetical protein EV07_1789 [Prochlorococcus sp. MIT 0603]
MQKKLVKDLEHLAANSAAKEGFEVVGLKLITQIKPMTIQVQIRHQDGGDVTLDDCSKMTGPISDSIERAQLVNSAYILEISSPGLNDILETDKEFETFKGFPIEVSTKNQSQSFVLKSGLLHTRSEEHLLINVKGKMNKIPRKDVIQVRLASPTG